MPNALRRRIPVVLLLLSLAWPAAAAKPVPVQSRWATSPIQVDGLPSEWTEDEFAALPDRGVRFAARNDNRFLYAFLKLEDPKHFSSVDQSGFVLWIDASGKSKRGYGFRFLRRTVPSAQLIREFEARGQSLSEERKAALMAKPQQQVFACQPVDKKGEPKPFPPGAPQGAFRFVQAGQAKHFEVILPLDLLQDPEGKAKLDRGQPFSLGLEWGGQTEEMRRNQLARMGDQSGRTDASATDLSSQIGGAEEGADFRAPGSSLASLRGPAKIDVWMMLSLDKGGTAAVASSGLPPNTPNTLTAAEKSAGWKLLFDGGSLSGWRGLGADKVPDGHWGVEDGTIRKIPTKDVPRQADGQPALGGDLMTGEAFRDFELAFEWKISPGGNSGVKYNVSEEMSVGQTANRAALGFEYQVLDDLLHPDAKNGPNRTAGALYDLVPPGPGKAVKPAGDWNAGRIVLRGGHGEHWLNGVKVLEFELDSPDFKARLAESKYVPIAGFSDRREGHIVLQDHADAAWFRSLRIRPL